MSRQQGDTRLVREKSSAWQVQTACAVLIAVAAYAASVAVLPAGLVLPVFSMVAFVAGAGMAFWGWLHGVQRQSDRLTCWDYAATCVFLGFAAGTLGNPEHVALISGGLPNL